MVACSSVRTPTCGKTLLQGRPTGYADSRDHGKSFGCAIRSTVLSAADGDPARSSGSQQAIQVFGGGFLC